MSNTKRTIGLALAWGVWALSLLASPAAMLVLAEVYYRPPHPENFGKELPWQAHLVDNLFLAHLAVSAAAAACVFWLTRDLGARVLACYVVLVMLGVAFWSGFVASMAVTGRYL
jgi:hypothetical protein